MCPLLLLLHARGAVPAATALAIILVPGAGLAAAAIAPLPPVATSSATSITDYVAQAAQRFDIPESWIYAVIRVESGGDVRAISSAGATGLMQIMPATWARLRARHGLGNDPFDPRDNIMAGTAFLREMYDRYGAPGFLAAYNAGPGRYDDYLSRGRPLPPETVTYLATMLPMVGNTGAPQRVANAAPDPLAWTRATLFPKRSAGASNVPRDSMAAAPEASVDPLPTNRQTVALTAAEPPSESLFIPVSGRAPR